MQGFPGRPNLLKGGFQEFNLQMTIVRVSWWERELVIQCTSFFRTLHSGEKLDAMIISSYIECVQGREIYLNFLLAKDMKFPFSIWELKKTIHGRQNCSNSANLLWKHTCKAQVLFAKFRAKQQVHNLKLKYILYSNTTPKNPNIPFLLTCCLNFFERQKDKKTKRQKDKKAKR